MTQPRLQQALEESHRELHHARATISGLTQSAKRLKAELARCRREKEEMGNSAKVTLVSARRSVLYAVCGVFKCSKTRPRVVFGGHMTVRK